MLRRAALFAAVVALAVFSVSNARASEKLGTARPNQWVLKDIVIWLSRNFDLPRILIQPNIEIVPPAEIEALRYKGFVWLAPRDIAVESQRGPLGARKVVALYDDAMKTIYLPEGWTGTTPAEQSVLVHEMVHHLQTLGKLKYDCPPAREQLAYAAQDQWLRLSGLNLTDEFEIDAFTLAISTHCIY